MTLKEIKTKLETASAGEVVTLSKEFDKTLQKLCREHKDYRDFDFEYRTEINELLFTRDPANAEGLSWLVDTVL